MILNAIINTVVVICIGEFFENAIFFFQAEDGIRGHCVTGVQTCALPIWARAIWRGERRSVRSGAVKVGASPWASPTPDGAGLTAPALPLCAFQVLRCRTGGEEPSALPWIMALDLSSQLRGDELLSRPVCQTGRLAFVGHGTSSPRQAAQRGGLPTIMSVSSCEAASAPIGGTKP